MSSTLPRRPQAHLHLWRRFHEALSRDAQRLTRLLMDRPDMSMHELTAWWDRFAPAVTQCDDIAARLFDPTLSSTAEAALATRSPRLGEAVEAMGLAIGLLPADADPEGGGGECAASDRAELARGALELVSRHEAETAEYLARSVAPDAYRSWERGAIAALAYRNVSFLAPWLLDGLSPADRSALLRDVPHIRVMRCDDVWLRRYQHITAPFRQPGHRPGPRPAWSRPV